MRDIQRNNILCFFTKPKEANLCLWNIILCLIDQTSPSLGMMLFSSCLSKFEILSVIGRSVIQNVRLPNAHLIPLLHSLCKLYQHICIGIQRANDVVQIVLCAAPVSLRCQTIDGYKITVGGNPAACHGRILCTIRIPWSYNAQLILICTYILKVSSHVFPAMNAILKTCFFCPVKTICKTMIGPLCVIVLRHQINVVIVLTQIPIVLRNSLISNRCILSKHLIT